MNKISAEGGLRNAPVAVDQHPSVRDNPRVECYLTGHGREQIIDGMVGAFVEAAQSGLRRTDNRYAWLDKARRARWDQVIAEPPQTDGLRERLAVAAAAAGDDTEDDLHDLAWFRRVAGRVFATEANFGQAGLHPVILRRDASTVGSAIGRRLGLAGWRAHERHGSKRGCRFSVGGAIRRRLPVGSRVVVGWTPWKGLPKARCRLVA